MHTDETAAILQQYADGPAQVAAALAGLTEDDLDAPAPAGGWTIRQIVHHLADGDDLWKAAVKMALGKCEDRFELQWYWGAPQDTWSERWAYARRAIEPSLALSRASRAHVVQLVEHVPGAWDCAVRIRWPREAEEERLTVGEIIAMQARHVPGHIEEIAAIRRARGR